MGNLFLYNGPVVVSLGSKFVSGAYLTLRRSSKSTRTSESGHQTAVDDLVITGRISGLSRRYSDGTVLTLEMYNGAKLDFTVDTDGTINNIGDVRNATGSA